jgi:gas vesicle protein
MSKFFSGIVIGAVLGVLLAPDKGSETRKKISKGCEDLRDKFSEFTESISNTFDNIRDEASDIMEQGRKDNSSNEEVRQNFS